jgi:hypothetical protein
MHTPKESSRGDEKTIGTGITSTLLSSQRTNTHQKPPDSHRERFGGNLNNSTRAPPGRQTGLVGLATGDFAALRPSAPWLLSVPRWQREHYATRTGTATRAGAAPVTSSISAAGRPRCSSFHGATRGTVHAGANRPAPRHRRRSRARCWRTGRLPRSRGGRRRGST